MNRPSQKNTKEARAGFNKPSREEAVIIFDPDVRHNAAKPLTLRQTQMVDQAIRGE